MSGWRAIWSWTAGPRTLSNATGDQLLGLFANQEMFQQRPEGQGDIYDPVVSLRQMTRKAIETLSQNKKGFFLVIEEEAIDEMAHSNNSQQTIDTVLELDRAVALGKRFAGPRRDTLLITTADHETGGMAIEALDNPQYPRRERGRHLCRRRSVRRGRLRLSFIVDWTTTGHTNVDVPLTAMGPGAARLNGVYENTFVHDVLVYRRRLAGTEPSAIGQQNPSPREKVTR